MAYNYQYPTYTYVDATYIFGSEDSNKDVFDPITDLNNKEIPSITQVYPYRRFVTQ